MLQRSVITILTCLALTPLPAVAPASPEDGVPNPPAERRDLTQDEARVVLNRILRGRPRSGLAYLDSLGPTSAGEPLFLLMRARCFQEFIPMDDAKTDFGRRMSEPSLGELDKCIDVCSARMEAGDNNPRLLLYRGWAWMAKSYVRSMTRNLFTAGREAKRGKSDLDAYLANYPNDPTANGLMGAFLYFADTIPSAFKFISKLLLLPTGDRERGLAQLQLAIEQDGLMRNDWRQILYNVYFYFEGRYEEGLAGLQQIVEEYPEYSRNAVPLAVSRPYVPTISGRTDAYIGHSIQRVYAGPRFEIDWNALYLVDTFRAYGERYCGDPALAAARLQRIVEEAPGHPDWINEFARYELGRLHAWFGHRKEASGLLKSVADGYGPQLLRDQAKSVLRDMREYSEGFENPVKQPDGRFIAAVYRSDVDSVKSLMPHFAELAPASLAASFYLGECYLLSDDLDKAMATYLPIIDIDAPGWEETYQMLAATRIAEILADRGDYRAAVDYQDKARRFYHKEYLVDWVLEGRKRYFERLAEGKESVTPTLLSSRQRGPVEQRPLLPDNF